MIFVVQFSLFQFCCLCWFVVCVSRFQISVIAVFLAQISFANIIIVHARIAVMFDFLVCDKFFCSCELCCVGVGHSWCSFGGSFFTTSFTPLVTTLPRKLGKQGCVV